MVKMRPFLSLLHVIHGVFGPKQAHFHPLFHSPAESCKGSPPGYEKCLRWISCGECGYKTISEPRVSSSGAHQKILLLLLSISVRHMISMRTTARSAPRVGWGSRFI